ncbi:hypothetical protein MHK_007076 [Candidatus Magnetomorum sp. HK-1]|nr:hypothetical protein MHK_007076 [Candidatus Magnetomorum sp. HK-1]
MKMSYFFEERPVMKAVTSPITPPVPIKLPAICEPLIAAYVPESIVVIPIKNPKI